MARRGLKFLPMIAVAGALAGCVAERSALNDPIKQAAVRTDVDLSATAPNWRVGDSWTYSDGYGLTVEDAVDGLATFRRIDDPDQWISRRGFLRQDAQSSTTLRSVVYRSIAAADANTLRAGAPLVFTREFTANGKTRIHTTSWMAEARERVSVPAGDYDCIVIVMRTRNPETGWTGFERWWYAPSVRHYVRMEYRYGDAPVASRVLTKFTAGAARQAVDAQNDPFDNQAPPALASSGAQNAIAPPTANQGPKATAPSGASPPPASIEVAATVPPSSLSPTP